MGKYQCVVCQDDGSACEFCPRVPRYVSDRVADGEIRWMVSLLESLYPDKLWVVPRSDSTFQRRGDQLVFLSGTHDEYLACRYNFGKIGVEVVVER
jgi:hypothetical protein